MHIVGKDYLLVALSKSEIETIISALHSDFHECGITNAGILLKQLEKVNESLNEQEC